MPKFSPILFSAPMVKALLRSEQAKTQTRRIVKPQPLLQNGIVNAAYCGRPHSWLLTGSFSASNPSREYVCPYGQPGDRLTVKEHAWMWCEKVPDGVTKKGNPKFRYVPLRQAQVFYCADHPAKPQLDVVCEYRGYQWGWRKKLGRFLPKWASRITLEIVSVRVERLMNITRADAIAEGIEPSAIVSGGKLERPTWRDYSLKSYDPFEWFSEPRDSYRSLWESINGPGSWNANPYVWVVEFKRVTS